MKLIDINQATITIELSPPDCLALFRMARVACQQQSLNGHIDLWQALTALFHACAIASYSQWHISAEDAETIEEQLAQVRLRPD